VCTLGISAAYRPLCQPKAAFGSGIWSCCTLALHPTPPRLGGKLSAQTLRHRIRCHYRGNASASTLRLTLGCLLSSQLAISLRMVGRTRRLTFHNGEEVLSRWMEQHAYVTWDACREPWAREKKLIRQVDLPLNLDMNSHPFRATLSRIRAEAKRRSRSLPPIQ
jgi:hypothetical protein